MSFYYLIYFNNNRYILYILAGTGYNDPYSYDVNPSSPEISNSYVVSLYTINEIMEMDMQYLYNVTVDGSNEIATTSYAPSLNVTLPSQPPTIPPIYNQQQHAAPIARSTSVNNNHVNGDNQYLNDNQMNEHAAQMNYSIGATPPNPTNYLYVTSNYFTNSVTMPTTNSVPNAQLHEQDPNTNYFHLRSHHNSPNTAHAHFPNLAPATQLPLPSLSTSNSPISSNIIPHIASPSVQTVNSNHSVFTFPSNNITITRPISHSPQPN